MYEGGHGDRPLQAGLEPTSKLFFPAQRPANDGRSSKSRSTPYRGRGI